MNNFLVALAFLASAATGFGQAVLYSFSGQVTGIHRDGAGTIAGLGWAIGDPVSVSFEVDFTQPGRVRLNDGYVEQLASYVWDDLRIDYFHARMVSGTLLPEVGGGMYNEPEHASEYLTGWNRADWQGNRGLLQGGSQDSHFRLQRFDPWPGSLSDWRVQDWQVGTMLQGYITGFSELDYSMMLADVRLDSITVVPEPDVLPLLLLGGLALITRTRRRERTWGV